MCTCVVNVCFGVFERGTRRGGGYEEQVCIMGPFWSVHFWSILRVRVYEGNVCV